MSLLSGGMGSKWVTFTSTSFRGPTTGQGGGSTALPTSYCDGQMALSVYGIIVNVIDAGADATITIGDARGIDIADYTLSSHKLEFLIKAGTVAPRYISLGGKPGIVIRNRMLTFRAANALTWASGARTLVRAGAFTTYTWRAGDQFAVDGGGLLTKNALVSVTAKTDNDTIVIDQDIGPDATTITGALIYGGGPTIKTSNALTTGSLFFEYGGHPLPDNRGSQFLFVNSTSATHPTDGQGNGTTTLSPVPAFGRGRGGARLYSFEVQSNHATVAQTVSIMLADGTGGFTRPIPPATQAVAPFSVNIGPPLVGLDFYSSVEGCFTAKVSDASVTGILTFDSPS